MLDDENVLINEEKNCCPYFVVIIWVVAAQDIVSRRLDFHFLAGCSTFMKYSRFSSEFEMQFYYENMSE